MRRERDLPGDVYLKTAQSEEEHGDGEGLVYALSKQCW